MRSLSPSSRITVTHAEVQNVSRWSARWKRRRMGRRLCTSTVRPFQLSLRWSSLIFFIAGSSVSRFIKANQEGGTQLHFSFCGSY